MMRNLLGAFRFGLAVLILAASGLANAQYFITIDVPPPAPPNCNANSVFFGSNTTLSYNFPAAPNNQVAISTANGVPTPDSPEVDSVTPYSGTVTDTINIAPLGTPTVPYTVVLDVFPALNGAPVGTGVRINVLCNRLGTGTGTATFSVVQAPSAAGIPAMSTQVLIALSLLLAGAAVWRLHGKRA